MRNLFRMLSIAWVAVALLRGVSSGAGPGGADSFHFAVMGCVHFGVCDSRDYELAVEKIKEQKPDFVLFLGGMVDITRESDLKKLWRQFDNITASMGVPVYSVYGDCALNPLSVSGDKIALSEKLYLERYKKRYYSFVHKNNLFILLDSSELDETGAAEQLKFLKTLLSGTSKYNHIFLAQHDSPWSRKKGARWAIQPIIQGKVDYVFGAGEHFFNVNSIGKTTYVTSGSPPCMSKRLRYPVFFHFLQVNVNRSNIDVSAIPLKAIPIKSFKGSRDDSLEKYQLVGPDVLGSADRKAMLPVKTVLKVLKIRPGMKIADVGSGTGLFTFPLAKTLGGDGKVFATEIDPDMTEYVKNRAKSEGYENVEAVTVDPGGIDSFYKKHTFDIILLSEVYHYFWRPEEYLRELKQSLSKNNGRLYIIHFKNAPDFNEVEFGDFSKTLVILKSKSICAYVSGKMIDGVGEFVENWNGMRVPADVRRKLIDNFNRLLSDRWLLNDLLKCHGAEGESKAVEWGRPLLRMASDIQLARWLIASLDEKDVFDKAKKELSESEKMELKTLNRLLLTGILQNDVLNFLKGYLLIYVEKKRIIRTLESAGFTFVQEHEELPYHYFLEFK